MCAMGMMMSDFCDFGKHRGVRWTRVPVGYLRWMINEGHEKADIAEAELKRRGTTFPDMEVSGHAIDRASQRLLGLWQETSDENEGLNSWLVRRAQAALSAHSGDLEGSVKTTHEGIKFVFEIKAKWPILKTVMKG